MPKDAPAATMRDLLALRSAGGGASPAILAPGLPAISYAELAIGIERVGDALAALGFGRGHRIATALPDSRDAGLAMLGAMTWATCAPLNPGLEPDASATLFAQLRIDALIVAEGDTSSVGAAALAAGLPIIRVSAAATGGADLVALRAESPRAPVAPVPPLPEDVALVMHTSGTTTRPKVVPSTHRALCVPGRRPTLAADDRFLCISPLHTSSGIGNGLTRPLRAGASTVLCPGFDAELFFSWLDTFRPTYFSASPTVHAAIMDAVLSRRHALPGSLRFVRSSSNGMAASLQEKLESVLGVPVIQGYGSTEAGLIAEDAPPPGQRRAGSVGKAAGTEILIVDEHDAAMPAGSVGEILVRGPAVMLGYENDPEANRRAFHEGWFRTGDLGHLDPDGYLYITGRVKEMINRGGLKVAPAEVDAAFLRHPAVQDAATVGIPHPSLGEDVAIAVILRPGATISATALRAWALAELAPFKVPTSVAFVREFPRNALGKVRRAALAQSLEGTLRPAFVPPRNADEIFVAGIFSALLEQSAVGALDNFFELGGDSLRAAQVLARVAAATGIELTPAVLFESPTVEQFALRLRDARCEARSPAMDTPQLVRRTHRRVAATVVPTPPARPADE